MTRAVDNLMSIGSGRYGFVFSDVVINGSIYESAVVVFHLLSPMELERLWSFGDMNQLSEALLEEDVFGIVFDGILDVCTQSEFDPESSSAGIVSTVVDVVLDLSRAPLLDINKSIEKAISEVSDLSKIIGVVSKSFNMSIVEVEKLPIDKVLRFFATNVAIMNEVSNEPIQDD